MPEGHPSILLQDRLDTALDYWEAHPEVTVVVSGGQGSNEPASEARCMADYLMDGGVPEDCSIVTASYSVDGRQIGTYGVLGPVRMDYAKVVSVLESVGDVLEKVIKNSNGGK